MKRTMFALLSVAALGLVGCDDDSDTLTDGRRGVAARDPGATAGGEDSTYNHSNDPGAADPGATFEPPDPAQVRAQGAPEVTSRLHSCGKMTVASLDHFLESRGLSGQGARPQGALSGRAIFNRNDSVAALGGANYNGRVPEAPFASTSAVSKMFDIFAMASYDAVDPNWEAPACPGVKLLENDQFTKDGISCLIGRPATKEHIDLANDAITRNPTEGAQIAVAALLAAAHTCQ